MSRRTVSIYRTSTPPAEVYGDPFPESELEDWWIVVGCQCLTCVAARARQPLAERRLLAWTEEAKALGISLGAHAS